MTQYSLALHTDCDLDARIGEHPDSGFVAKASSEKRRFLRVAQLRLDGRDHGCHTPRWIDCGI